MTVRAARAVAAFAVGYLLPGTLRLPVLVYHPVTRAVTFSAAVSGLSMRYYGDLLVACLAGFAGWMLPPRRTPAALATGVALSLVALDVLFYLSRLLAAR